MGGFEPEDFTLPYCGDSVTLRGLSGYEVVLGRKVSQGDEIVMNAFMIGVSMGGTVKTAAADGQTFMEKHLAGDYNALANKIQELSGMAEGARKSGVPGDGERAGS